MQTIIAIITGIVTQTPLWVWAVLAYGLFAGIRSMRQRQIHMGGLLLMPVVFLVLALQSVANAATFSPLFPLAWSVALLIGFCLGWRFLSPTPLSVDRARWSITLPGSWIGLALFILVFGTKYAYGVYTAMNPDAGHHTTVLLAILGLSGLSTGIMTGRVALWYHHFLKRDEARTA